jgi:hypothetical protein
MEETPEAPEPIPPPEPEPEPDFLPVPDEDAVAVPAPAEADPELGEEEEDDGEEEDLTDEELARIALTQPERAEVARRRMERKARRARPKVKKVIEPEVAEVMQSEGIPLDLDVEGIVALTGEPAPGDEFYAAYAVLAPSSALRKYTYVVKFVPGEMKKGKAWAAMAAYLTGLKIPPEHAALMKLIPEGDVINQLPYAVRIIFGAGGQAQQKKAQQAGRASARGGKKKK